MSTPQQTTLNLYQLTLTPQAIARIHLEARKRGHSPTDEVVEALEFIYGEMIATEKEADDATE